MPKKKPAPKKTNLRLIKSAPTLDCYFAALAEKAIKADNGLSTLVNLIEKISGPPGSLNPNNKNPDGSYNANGPGVTFGAAVRYGVRSVVGGEFEVKSAWRNYNEDVHFHYEGSDKITLEPNVPTSLSMTQVGLPKAAGKYFLTLAWRHGGTGPWSFGTARHFVEVVETEASKS